MSPKQHGIVTAVLQRMRDQERGDFRLAEYIFIKEPAFDPHQSEGFSCTLLLQFEREWPHRLERGPQEVVLLGNVALLE